MRIRKLTGEDKTRNQNIFGWTGAGLSHFQRVRSVLQYTKAQRAAYWETIYKRRFEAAKTLEEEFLWLGKLDKVQEIARWYGL